MPKAGVLIPVKVRKPVTQVKPFLKWAGGKFFLVPQLSTLLPDEFENYFEPFFGSGALYFYLTNQGFQFKANINDINPHLMNSYRRVRDDLPALLGALGTIQEEYLALDSEQRKDFYYRVREIFNQQPKNSLVRAALLIFLNRTGYNGMYRENLQGQYNIPFGREKGDPIIRDTGNLSSVSEHLKASNITSGPYEEALGNAKRGDLVYLDPPYYPTSRTSRFTRYTEHDFLDEDQFRLKEVFDELARRGCFVIMSNSKTQFIQSLYCEYRQEIVFANRRLNSRSTGRGKIEELVILSY